MSTDVSVETPVMVEDELVVSCEHCGDERSVGTTVDAVEADVSDDDWKILFVPRDDGRLVVDVAQCPEHRTDKAIDEFAREQSEMARRTYTRSKAVLDQVDS